MFKVLIQTRQQIRKLAAKTATKPTGKPSGPIDNRLSLIKQMLYSKDSTHPKKQATHVKIPKPKDSILDEDLEVDQIERAWMAHKTIELHEWQKDIQKLYSSTQQAMKQLELIDKELFEMCLEKSDPRVPMKSRIPVEVVGLGWDYDLDRAA